jgi:hypothetical protein
MLIQRNSDDSYSVTGEGPMRPIAVEGYTRKEAMQEWMTAFGIQYEEQERHTHHSLQMGASYDD